MTAISGAGPIAYTLLWGDIHRQTALTCGEGTYADHLRAAKQSYQLDFLAVTDNACLAEDPRLRQFAGDRLRAHRHFFPAPEAHSLPPKEWNRLRRLVAEVKENDPIFLLGYEWCSNRYGDRNVYYLDDGPLALPAELYGLYEAAAANQALLVVHHPGYARGRRGVDWNHHDPHRERLVEIFSTQHGSSEGPEGDADFPLFSRSMGGLCAPSSVQEALLRRYKLGFAAGSDSHSLNQTPGLTGVYATCRSRRALWDGLMQRRTIATTGPKFALWFAADGHPLGSILTTDRLPEFTICLARDGWERAELVRNGVPVKIWSQACAAAAERDAGSETVTLRYAEIPSDRLWPDNYYYVRVSLTGRHRAWSSPIWISYLPDAPFAQDTLYWLPEERCAFWVERTRNWARCTVQNRYVAMAGAGGLRAPPDVTLHDVHLEVVGAGGQVISAHPLGSLPEGAFAVVHVDCPPCLHWFRLRFCDCFNNARCIERHMAVAEGQEAVFRIVEADR